MDKVNSNSMNAHKAMAGAGSSFTVGGYPGKEKGAKGEMGIGTKGAMDDGSRGIGGATVSRGKGMHGAQAHPDHGPMSDHFARDGKA